MGRKLKLLRVTLFSVAFILAFSVLTLAADSNVYVGTVKVSSSLNLRQSASSSSSVIGSLANGSKVAICGLQNDWYKVAVNGITGYANSDYIVKSSSADFAVGNGIITGSVVNIRKEPNTSSSVLAKVSKGVIVNVVGVKDGWFKVKYSQTTGYVYPDYLQITKASSTTSRSLDSEPSGDSSAPSDSGEASDLRKDLISYAKKYLGVEYVYGGASPDGFDCSGFTYYVFKHFDISLSRSSAAQYTDCTVIKKSELLPGDLVFFTSSSSKSRIGHVGIYIGDNKFIHAESPGKDVCISSLSDSYYSKHYKASGRVL